MVLFQFDIHYPDIKLVMSCSKIYDMFFHCMQLPFNFILSSEDTVARRSFGYNALIDRLSANPMPCARQVSVGACCCLYEADGARPKKPPQTIAGWVTQIQSLGGQADGRIPTSRSSLWAQGRVCRNLIRRFLVHCVRRT